MAYTARTIGWFHNAPVGTALRRKDGKLTIKARQNQWLGRDGESGGYLYDHDHPFGYFEDIDLIPAIYEIADVRASTVWIPLPAGTVKWAEAVYAPLLNGDYEIEGVPLDFDKPATFTPPFMRVIVPRLAPDALEHVAFGF